MVTTILAVLITALYVYLMIILFIQLHIRLIRKRY